MYYVVSYLVIPVESNHDGPDRQEPVCMHSAYIVSNKFMIRDGHNTEYEKVQSEQHFQKTKYGVVFPC